MNWGRGLFRLWASIAVLWIGGTTWLQWREIRCDWDPSRQGCNVFDDASQVSLPKGFVLDPKPDPWKVVSKTPIELPKLSEAQLTALINAGGDFTKLTEEMRKSILASLEVKRTPNDDWKDIPGQKPDQWKEFKPRPVQPWEKDPVISQETASPTRYDKLIDDAAPIFGPPLLLLMIGSLFYWAIKGFRGTSS